MRRGVVIVGTLVVCLAAIPMAGAQSADRCAEAFPEAVWEPVPTSSAVPILASGVPDAQQRRFAQEIEAAAGWITAEMGAVAGSVCLIGPESAFDRSRFEEGSIPFHAALVAEEGVIAVSTGEQLGRVGAAATFGLAHLRLWQEAGGAGWPEPLASAVAHWYRNRLLDRIEQRHVDARSSNFFANSSQIDWDEANQSPLLLWNPVANDSAIGDLVDHAVAAEGVSVLLDDDPGRWADREARWRVSLRTELTGRASPTTLWISGVAIAIGVVLVAALVAWLGFRSKRRLNARRPTPPPLPGFFSDDDHAAPESAGERR